MIAAFDVGYPNDGSALAAAVIFQHFSDAKPRRAYRQRFARVEKYIPGSFYLRELPCILELLAKIEEPLEIIIIDGYVSLGDQPGLGQHLSKSLGQGIPIIGVAKNPFAGGNPVEVRRGKSKNPLYITACGVPPEKARELIESMHGRYRIPTLLKEVDRLSKATGLEREMFDATGR